jgi:WD40 repeat protein
MSFCELTSSTRSILYSAHILWDRLDHILVAAGTAFGEIIFWSWTRKPTAGPNARIHHVFLGHEGSIFGVQISKELELAPGKKRQRLLASCSDDRTIRIWDVTTVSYNEDTTPVPDEDLDTQRTRHTGFSNTAFDEEPSSAACIAIGWGHISRVWTVQFLDALQSCSSQSLLSTGEDATSRTWNLIPKDLPLESKTEAQIYNLFQTSTTAHHSGKNIWSVTVCGNSTESQQVICGSADSKITARPLDCTRQSTAGDMSHVLKEYTVEDVVSLAQCSPVSLESNVTAPAHKSSRVSEFFRSYSFTDRYSFLLTTNSGQIYVGSVSPDSTESGNTISSSTFIDRIEELSGYSVCVGELSLGIGYVAGSRGGIYIHQKNVSHLQKIHTVTGKVGSMFADGPNLLITLLGQKVAQLLRVDVTDAQGPSTSDPINVDLSDLETGTVVTSMEYVTTASGVDFIFLGFRKGDIAICRTERRLATGIRVLEHVHKKETVTSLKWIPSSSDSLFGHLISVGRDGCCAIHSIDLSTQGAVLDSTLVHYLALPFGSNIEGFYYHYDHLIVYGFSSTKFVLYDTTTEEEIMSVDAGGAHRSWAFQPNPSEQGGGTLVWTRASSMHTFTQQGPNHQVIRSGGHGREIKAVASCVLKTANGTSKQLIATGAEDTDIKIFENTADGAFVCRRTLRKHTTGIQQLQWSEDGEYLFSSGGCEEFYVWRVRLLPDALGVGVVCEDVFEPESEHSDLRIMSFAVQRKDDSKKGFVIALVFSDSTIRVGSLLSKILLGH